jgi:ferredoxin--NADP+ reductase
LDPLGKFLGKFERLSIDQAAAPATISRLDVYDSVVSTTIETVGEPALPEVKMHLVPPNAPAAARVTGNTLCLKGRSSSFVRHVSIDIAGTPLAGAFRAGQSFGVVPPGVDAHGRPHKVRLYSIASPTWGEDGHGRVFATTPKRLIVESAATSAGEVLSHPRLFLGVCSNHLCDLAPGDPVQVTGPAGKRFLLPVDPSQHDFLFLATGTGIAPFRGMLMELLAGPPEGSPWRATWKRCSSRIELLMGSPYTSDLLYDEQLQDLAKANPNFHYHPVISRERRADGGRGEYVHQFLERRLADFEPMLRSPRTLIYVCGLAGMQIGLFRLLAAKGHAAQYLTIDESIRDTPPDQWSDEQIKRRVRHTHRCMIEVY